MSLTYRTMPVLFQVNRARVDVIPKQRRESVAAIRFLRRAEEHLCETRKIASTALSIPLCQ
jgi:hypothetical protein